MEQARDDAPKTAGSSEANTKKPKVRLDEDQIERVLRDGHNGIFTTLRRDGVPVALPVWYVALDRKLYITTRGKKVQRVRHDARASFLLEGGQAWEDLWGVHLTGRAQVVEPDHQLMQRITDEEERKYRSFRPRPEQLPDQVHATYSVPRACIEFTPDERVLSWWNAQLVGAAHGPTPLDAGRG